MSTVMTKYTRLEFNTEEAYFKQACAELYPTFDHPHKAQLRTAYDKIMEGGVDRPEFERPDECPALSPLQIEFAEGVSKLVMEYFDSASPSATAVYTFLAFEGLDPKEGYHISEGKHVIDLFARFVDLGKGAYDYIARRAVQQTHVDPRFIVIRLADDCRRYGVRTLRAPTAKGEVMFSLDPLQHHKNFDNQTFIPAIGGYYGIVGKASAEE